MAWARDRSGVFVEEPSARGPTVTSPTSRGPSVGVPTPIALLLQQRLSVPRVRTYLDACGGDLDQAIELYAWNVGMSGAVGETLSYVEVLLRNAMNDALASRHVRRGRPGQWYDDLAPQFEDSARQDVARAKARAQRGSVLTPGNVVAELPFGFWRYLLARRYTSTVWPAVRPAFPHLPRSDRGRLEQPVGRLHKLRNRAAHHEPLFTQPLASQYDDMLDVVGFIDPALRTWVHDRSRVTQHLARRP